MRPRPIRIDYDVAYITLTQGLIAVIDADDVPMVDGLNWHAHIDRHTVYAQRSAPRDVYGNRLTIMMHRIIMGAPDNMQVDHIDGDGLNNRRENLRIATPSQNQHNQRISSRNKSGFKGVSWHAKTGKWQANIQLHGKKHQLGMFDTPEEAAAAYAAGSEKFHGEFGRLE